MEANAASRKPGSKSTDTKLKLMRSAEELYATRGVDNVSLAEINKHAGQRNEKAVTYHFGGKLNLIMAIFDRHSTEIEYQRGVMLDEMEGTPSVTELVELIVLPIAAKLHDSDGGRHYLKISSQMLDSPDYTSMRFRHASTREQLLKVQEMLQPYVAQVSKEERSVRDLFAYRMLYQGLAFAAEGTLTAPEESFVSILVEVIENILTGSTNPEH
jgi:AcrR family transcriptional regulator